MIKVEDLRALETYLATVERSGDVMAYTREGGNSLEIVVDCADGVTRRWSIGVAQMRSPPSGEFRSKLFLRRNDG